MADVILSGTPSPRKELEVLNEKQDQPEQPEQPEENKPDKPDEDEENLDNLDSRGETSSSGGVLISVTINILLIVSFLMEFKIGDAGKMNYAIQQEFENYPISTDPQMFLSGLSKMEETIFFIENVVIDNVLNPNKRYTPLKYANLMNETVNQTWWKSNNTNSTNPTASTEDESAGTDTSGGTGTDTSSSDPSGGARRNLRGNRFLNMKAYVKNRTQDKDVDHRLMSNMTRSLQDTSNWYMEEEEEADTYIPPVDEDYSTKTYSQENSYYFLNSFNLFKGMLITAVYDDNFDYIGNTPTEIFLPATTSQYEAKQALTDLMGWLGDGYIVSINMDTIFFNVVNQVGLYYEIQFSQKDTSSFTMTKQVKPFFPKVFDSDYEDKQSTILILLFRCLFGLTLLLRIAKVIIIDLYKALKTFIQTRQLDLPMTLVFDIIVLGALVLLLVLSVYNSFNQAGTFEIFDVIDQDLFEKFLGYADFLNIFLKFLAVIIGLLIVQILLLLNTQFPTFGVLFYTLGAAKNKLLLYAVTIVTLMVSFVMFMTINFGPYDEDMSNFLSSFLLVFEFIISTTDVDKLKKADETVAYIYFFFFYTIFNLTVLILFVAIIISTYVQLRKKLQLTTLALAELAAEKSNKLKEKYINLILFRNPDDVKAEAEEEAAAQQEEVEKKKKGKKEKQEKKKPVRRSNKKKNLLEILLYNLEEVDWFGFTNNTRQTRDQIEEEIRNKIAEIKLRKIEEKKRKMAARKSGVFEKISNMTTYLIFIIIYTYALTYQLQIDASFDLNQTLENYYIKTKFTSTSGLNKTFYDITTVEDAVLYTREAYLGRIFSGFTKSSQNKTTILQPYDQNMISSTAVTRITIRNLKTYTVKDATGENEFTLREPISISFTDKHTSAETVADITSNDGLLSMTFTDPGTDETFRQKGGYVWAIDRSLTNARNAVAELQHPKVINLNTAIIAYQTVYLNRNYELFGLSEFVLDIDSTGIITKFYKTKVFYIDLYSCDVCTAKAIFELIYLFCVLKQTYDIIKKWFEEWKGTTKITPVKRELEGREWYIRLLNYDLDNIKFLPFTLHLIMRIWQIIRRMWETTMNLFKRDYANLVITFSLFLTFVGLGYYFRFMNHPFRKDFQAKVDFSHPVAGFSSAAEIGNYEDISLLIESYTTIQAFNSWLIILRILFEFGFSRELSLVLDLLAAASFDIIFFIAMFFIILFGFAIDGFLLFGTQASSFKDIGQSFIQVLVIMVTGNTPGDLVNTEKAVKAVYFILLVILCTLILMKMFLAILDGHFTELTADQHTNDKLGVLELIVTVVIEKVKAAKIEEDYEVAPADAGKFTRLRIEIINRLKEYRHKILLNLRRIIFGSEDYKTENKEDELDHKIHLAKKIDLDIKFFETKEDRKEDLKDIEVYINEEKKPFELNSPGIEGESREDKENKLNDDMSLPSKWMNKLEESVIRVTNNKVNFGQSGIGAEDYLDKEISINSDLIQKLSDIEGQCQEDRPASMPLTDYYVDYVAIPDYKGNLLKNYKSQNFYLSLVGHLQFLFYKSLKTIHGDTEPDDHEGEGEIIEDPEERGTHHIHKSTSTRKRFVPNEFAGYKEASFVDPRENLGRFWDTLKFSHQYELWAGERADLLSNDIRHCLWQQMKFKAATFGPFVPKDEFIDNDLKPDEIGMDELKFIWDHLKVSPDKTFEVTRINKKLSTANIDLIEHVIRSNMENIIFELRKFESIKDKIKFLQGLKTVKNDSKLMLWLLTPPQAKLELVLRIQDPILSEFSILLLMEEIYDNVYLLKKLEKSLDDDMRCRVYMHFLYFANYEASSHNLNNHRDVFLPDSDPDLLDYIKFLESQFESTNEAKKKCLDEINKILHKEENAKSLLDISRGEIPALKGMEKLAMGKEPSSRIDLTKTKSSSKMPRKITDDASLMMRDAKVSFSGLDSDEKGDEKHF